MKLDRTKYLELVVHHEDSTLCEFPSRFCVIRIPILDGSIKGFSFGQIKKLISIGLNPETVFNYKFVPHREFDYNFCVHYIESNILDFYHMFIEAYSLYFDKSFFNNVVKIKYNVHTSYKNS